MLHAQCRDAQTDAILDDGVRIDWKWLRFSRVGRSEDVSALSTRGLFLRVADFLATGGFRPRQLPHYLSDYEFTIRAKRLGIRPLVDSRLRLWTKQNEGMTSTLGTEAAWQVLFSRKNPLHPRAWIMFVILACPWPWKPTSLLIVGVRSMRIWAGLAKSKPST
jgi:hypothetical protein